EGDCDREQREERASRPPAKVRYDEGKKPEHLTWSLGGSAEVSATHGPTAIRASAPVRGRTAAGPGATARPIESILLRPGLSRCARAAHLFTTCARASP